MILSNAKTFNEKMRGQFVKIWKKKKKYQTNFLRLSIDDIKTKKKQMYVCWYKNTQQ